MSEDLGPDPVDSARELAERIYHAVHLVPDDGTGLTKHVVWEVRSLMQQLNPNEDLTGMEMMAIAVILASANDRRLRRSPDRPGVTGVPEEVAGPLLRLVNATG